MSGKKGTLLSLAIILIFVFSILSVVSADNIVQTLKANTGVRIFYNDKELIDERQPYIINGSAYVPIRMLMENLDKIISFEPSANKVIIKDKADPSSSTISSLKDQIAKLQLENSSLVSQNTYLAAENKNLTTKISTLTKKMSALTDYDDELSIIENKLQKEYGYAGDDYINDDDVSVFISVIGDDDDVELEVSLDFIDAKHEKMTDYAYANIRNLLKAIYDDLKDELDDSEDYKDAAIEAILEDDDGNVLEYDGSTFAPKSW